MATQLADCDLDHSQYMQCLYEIVRRQSHLINLPSLDHLPLHDDDGGEIIIRRDLKRITYDDTYMCYDIGILNNLNELDRC